MNYKENVLDAIGNTPLIKLNKIKEKFSLKSDIYAKLERNNPSGSIKDRAAKSMILDAIKKGHIKKDTIIVEETSGNMGISLAMIASYLNLPIYLFMPSSASKERIQMMKAYGANVILTDSKKGMKGAQEAALKFLKEHKNAYRPSQFVNENNPLTHYENTASEIYDDLEGKVDIFIAGFGTGGTISGVGKKLKELNKNIKVIGVEPSSSPLISKGKASSHLIQGIGANFKPDTLHLEYVDEIKTVTNEDAYEYTRILAKEEGILCGISSGCNIYAAIEEAKKHKGKNIITVLPDNGERYLSLEDLFYE